MLFIKEIRVRSIPPTISQLNFKIPPYPGMPLVVVDWINYIFRFRYTKETKPISDATGS